MLAGRERMDESLRRQYNKKICANLKAYFAGENGELLQRGVFGYYPHRSEADLREFYRWLLSRQVPLAFPRVSGETMDFYRIASLKELRQGTFGIYEPCSYCARAGWETAVCFVPGSVFDRRGNRYGYGKGYYDRYFDRYEDVCRIGVAYGIQVEPEIPAERHDKTMHALVTEEGVAWMPCR